jgi:hypothetical protein
MNLLPDIQVTEKVYDGSAKPELGGRDSDYCGPVNGF